MNVWMVGLQQPNKHIFCGVVEVVFVDQMGDALSGRYDAYYNTTDQS